VAAERDGLRTFWQTGTAQRGSGGSSVAGTSGGSCLDMRALGAQRTLVLLDGSRMMPADKRGSTNIDVFPTALIRSVEVVTGGASAAYGAWCLALHGARDRDDRRVRPVLDARPRRDLALIDAPRQHRAPRRAARGEPGVEVRAAARVHVHDIRAHRRQGPAQPADGPRVDVPGGTLLDAVRGVEQSVETAAAIDSHGLSPSASTARRPPARRPIRAASF